jgi:hypothetical protein
MELNGLEWVNLTHMTIISTTVGKNPLEEMEHHHSQQKSPKCSTWMQSQKQQDDLCSFPREIIEYHAPVDAVKVHQPHDQCALNDRLSPA